MGLSDSFGNLAVKIRRMVQGLWQESGIVVERQSVTGRLASIIQSKKRAVQKVKAASSG